MLLPGGRRYASSDEKEPGTSPVESRRIAHELPVTPFCLQSRGCTASCVAPWLTYQRTNCAPTYTVLRRQVPYKFTQLMDRREVFTDPCSWSFFVLVRVYGPRGC
jgi:hypothetical protein